MIADFGSEAVELKLSKAEYVFLHLALSYVLDGVALADHDFANILGMARSDAEAMRDDLVREERKARERGTHWSPAQPP
jgi:hypothetical protein